MKRKFGKSMRELNKSVKPKVDVLAFGTYMFYKVFISFTGFI